MQSAFTESTSWKTNVAHGQHEHHQCQVTQSPFSREYGKCYNISLSSLSSSLSCRGGSTLSHVFGCALHLHICVHTIPATKHEQCLWQRPAVHLHRTNSTMASGAGFTVVKTGVSILLAKLQPYLAGSGNSAIGTMSLHQIIHQK